MKKKIVIFALASAPHTVVAYHQIAKAFLDKNIAIKLIGLVVTKSSGDLNNETENSFKKNNYSCFTVPSLNSSQQFIGLIKNLNRKFHPDIFLADSEKQFSVHFSKTLDSCNHEKHIPFVLIDHGFGNGCVYLLIYKNIFWQKIINVYRCFRDALSPSEFRPKLFGENCSDYICAFSKFNSDIYNKFGIDKKKVRFTGYPYFDEVYHAIKKNHNSKINKKILIVSSGICFWNKEDANIFYDQVLSVYKFFKNEYQIHLRLKPEEKLENFLSTPIYNEITRSQIKFDNNNFPSYQTVANYDLIIGDPSTVLIEALLFKKPVAVFKYASMKIWGISLEQIWNKILGVLIIGKNDNLKTMIDKALAKKYQKKIYSHFEKNKNMLLWHFDGKAGDRIASVMVEAISKFQ